MVAMPGERLTVNETLEIDLIRFRLISILRHWSSLFSFHGR